MIITPAAVKELRERTGAGMMECKKALVESNGDLEAAVIAMRKAGQAKASKKAGRVASQGVVLAKISTDLKKAIIVEINSETDFVARGDVFKSFAEEVSACVLANWCLNTNTLAALPIGKASDQTVEEARQSLVSKVAENIQIRRIGGFEATKPDSFLAAYQHGGKIGVLVETLGGTAELAKDLAMHIAASNPEAISPSEISEARVEKEMEIFRAQALSIGKPANIVEKMVAGRVKNFVTEISLLGQEFVKDPTKTVEILLKEQKASVVQFIRYELGEGIEKVKDGEGECKGIQ